MELLRTLTHLLILALPVACIAWTVTHEEIFRELRDWCQSKSRSCTRLVNRRFFYVFTCEYCFSHYVAGAVVVLVDYRLLYNDWRGYAVGLFSLVAIANFYMAVFARLRLEIKENRLDITAKEATETPGRQPRASI